MMSLLSKNHAQREPSQHQEEEEKGPRMSLMDVRGGKDEKRRDETPQEPKRMRDSWTSSEGESVSVRGGRCNSAGDLIPVRVHKCV